MYSGVKEISVKIQIKSVIQRKTNTILFHSYVKLKKQTSIGNKEREGGKRRNRLLTLENNMMVIRGEVSGGIGEIGG